MPVTLDRERLNEMFEEQPELLCRMINRLEAEADRQMAAIRAGLEAGDATALGDAAHRLCGSVGCFCAPACTEAAGILDEMGRVGDLARASTAVAHLERELALLQVELRAIHRELAS